MLKFLKKNLNLLSHRVFLVPLIMILQLIIIFFMIFEFYNYFVIFYVLCAILSILLVLHIVNSNANPGYKIAWIIPIMAFPIFGLLLYSLFGGNQLSKKQKEKLKNIYYKQLKYKDNNNLVAKELSYENIAAYNQVKYIQNYSLTNLCKHTKTTYLSNGQNYFSKLIETLKNAKKFILGNANIFHVLGGNTDLRFSFDYHNNCDLSQFYCNFPTLYKRKTAVIPGRLFFFSIVVLSLTNGRRD